MQIGDKVVIEGTIAEIHGHPSTHAAHSCSVVVEIPGGQRLWVNQSCVAAVAPPAPDPVEEAKPRRGRHTKHVAAIETPGDNPRLDSRTDPSDPSDPSEA